MLKQKRKFNKSSYTYDLTIVRETCLDEICNNITKDVFCSKRCKNNNWSRLNRKNIQRVYQLRCPQCKCYFLNKMSHAKWCSNYCANKFYVREHKKYFTTRNLTCRYVLCSNLFVPTKMNNNKYCSIKCVDAQNEYKRQSKGQPPFRRECKYRYCTHNFMVSFTKNASISKQYCSRECTMSEYYYAERLPNKHSNKKQTPLYFYILFNKESNCYKFGVTITKRTRYATHARSGFVFVESRYYPKYGYRLEATFKRYLKDNNIKPALSIDNMPDGWSETVSAEDIPNLSIDMISKIYKEKGKV